MNKYLTEGQNPLEILPDNVIRNICSDLDDVSLLNLAKKYKRVNIVCSQELKLRRKNVIGSVDHTGVFRILDKRQFRGKTYGKPCISYTVVELQSLCKYLNLPTSGSKKILCDRLKDSLIPNIHPSYGSVPQPQPIQPELLPRMIQPELLHQPIQPEQQIRTEQPETQLELQSQPTQSVENYSEQDLNRMTVVQLRVLLKSNGLKVPRLKADMVKSLYQAGIQKYQPVSYESKNEIKKEIKTEPKKESKNEIKKVEPKLRTKCDSQYDFITLESWDESPPDIFINFIIGGGKNVMKCYQSETLKQWLSDTSNTFARWVQIYWGIPMDDNGRNGKPDLSNTFVKLYTGEFLVYDRNVQDLINGKKNIILDVKPLNVERIGNLRGTSAMSEHHGQLPGYQVYKIINITPAINI